jgi:hypothetical protein
MVGRSVVTRPGIKALFWFAVAVQVAGAQIILWHALPIYQRLIEGGRGGGRTKDFAMGLAGVALMQSGFWVALQIQPRLHFRRMVLLGQVFLFVGEVSFVFVSALATVIFFERWDEVEFSTWRLIVFVAILFAVFCYKTQLESLGHTMRESPGQGGEHGKDGRQALPSADH